MSRLLFVPATGRTIIRAARPLILTISAALWLSGCAMKMPSFSGLGTAKTKSNSQNLKTARGVAYDNSRQTTSAGGYRPASPWVWSNSARGTREIVVKPGESLYGISSRRNVAISEIMAANSMSSPTVVPGQRLIVPMGSSRSRNSQTARYNEGSNSAGGSNESSTTRNDRLFERSRSALGRNALTERAGSAPVSSGASETYRVRSGDTLYGIARRNGVNAARLASHNGLSDPSNLPIGMSLQIPR